MVMCASKRKCVVDTLLRRGGGGCEFLFPKNGSSIVIQINPTLLPPRKEFFIVFSRVCDFVLFLFFLSVITITLERLNQSESNFHTRILTEIAWPCTKGYHSSHVTPP